jgi:hypothetical protein
VADVVNDEPSLGNNDSATRMRCKGREMGCRCVEVEATARGVGGERGELVIRHLTVEDIVSDMGIPQSRTKFGGV